MRQWIARYRFVLAALIGPLAASALIQPAIAQTEPASTRLDALFAQLRAASNESAARSITNQIWLHWTKPEDPRLAAQMATVLMLRQRADFPGAIALLDTIIDEHPDYAEAFNQRATIYYLLRNYQRSMADIDQVLTLEPRHFGALTGRAVMYENLGLHDKALEDMTRALSIHPFLAERALFPELKSLIGI